MGLFSSKSVQHDTDDWRPKNLIRRYNDTDWSLSRTYEAAVYQNSIVIADKIDNMDRKLGNTTIALLDKMDEMNNIIRNLSDKLGDMEKRNTELEQEVHKLSGINK